MIIYFVFAENYVNSNLYVQAGFICSYLYQDTSVYLQKTEVKPECPIGFKQNLK